MNEKIMNITSDGRVACDQFNISFSDFYELMIDKIIDNYELYHFNYDVNINCYVATYGGIEYQVKFDNDNLNEIEDNNSLDHELVAIDKQYDKDNNELSKLVSISNQSEEIVKFKSWIKECEEHNNFFDKRKFLGLNTLSLDKWEIDKIKRADIVFSALLIFLNLFGFFIPFIREFYTLLGKYALLSFVPLFGKYIYDLNSLYSDKGKTSLYYILYPIWFIFSKKKCQKYKEYCINKIKIKTRSLNEYVKLIKEDFNKSKEIINSNEEKTDNLDNSYNRINVIEENFEENNIEMSKVIKKAIKR